MTFVDLFRDEVAPVWRRLALFAALSGLSNAAVLATINAAAGSDGDALGRTVILLALSIVVYSVTQKGLMVTAAGVAEHAVDGLRGRFIRRLRGAGLQDVERLDRSALYTAMGGEMQALSDGALSLIIVGQAAVLLAVTMLYLATLSLVALALAVVFIGVAASFHLGRAREIAGRLATGFQLEARMLDGFTDFIGGFKEVKQSAARSADLTLGLRHLSTEVAQTRLHTRDLFANDFVASQVAFFLLTGIMVFVVPMFGDVDRATVIKVTATSLFLIGPISTVVAGLPVLQRVNAAAEAVLAVERRLDALTTSEADAARPPAPFRSLALRNVTFRYDADGEGGFGIGPVDLDVSPGRVIFITGGNGSGKSTLLKLMVGLYKPTGGLIALDDTPVDGDAVAAYRELFAVIFSDNHLFRRLYGLGPVPPARSQPLLETLELEGKVGIVDREFTTVALSGGQRKRLAMAAALLEDRQIYVFDEWAADQDPHFREKFYREIIPSLVRKNKTVIAVTHDERYFDIRYDDVAAARFEMTAGRLEPAAPAAAPL